VKFPDRPTYMSLQQNGPHFAIDELVVMLVLRREFQLSLDNSGEKYSLRRRLPVVEESPMSIHVVPLAVGKFERSLGGFHFLRLSRSQQIPTWRAWSNCNIGRSSPESCLCILKMLYDSTASNFEKNFVTECKRNSGNVVSTFSRSFWRMGVSQDLG
jgi:hypothetical protein